MSEELVYVKIHSESKVFSNEAINHIEKQYNARYVFESCVKTIKGEWCDFPVSVFYTEKAHPQGSNWFGIYYVPLLPDEDPSTRRMLICNAITATEPFNGIQVGDDVYYSRYRHDYREYGDVSVDGGRDYLRYGGPEIDKIKTVKLKVVEDRLEICNEQDSIS
jgi:hypothetical protein